ncbi:SAM-dependent methyltransferase [Spirillospora sp. NPDC052269]
MTPDTARPSPARVYDYLLGGHDHLDIDRAAAEAVLKVEPDARESPRRNRDFLGRAVRHLAGLGVDQFLDIGSGLPTAENVHHVAQSVNPDARVVYADNDATVLEQANALLSGDDRTAFVHADVRDPAALLADPALALLDLDRPVAVLLVAVLHFVADADGPSGLVETLLASVAPGSHLVISHVTDESTTPELRAAIHETYANAPAPLYLRPRTEIEALFGGRPLIAPGLVDVQDWRPAERLAPARLRLLGGVAPVG